MKRNILIIIIVIAVGIVGYVLYSQFGKWYGESMDAALEQEQQVQKKRIEELEEQISKDSHNSNKPPSSDNPYTKQEKKSNFRNSFPKRSDRI